MHSDSAVKQTLPLLIPVIFSQPPLTLTTLSSDTTPVQLYYLAIFTNFCFVCKSHRFLRLPHRRLTSSHRTPHRCLISGLNHLYETKISPHQSRALLTCTQTASLLSLNCIVLKHDTIPNHITSFPSCNPYKLLLCML